MPLWTPSPLGAHLLGKTVPLAGSATTTPTLVFGPGYEWLLVYFFIPGYSGASIARLQLGTAATPDTAANYSMITGQFVAGGATVGTTTSRVSQAGIEVANVATTNGRRGRALIWNPATDPKFAECGTITYTSQTPAAATAAHASLDSTAGNWWNNAEAQCIRLEGGSSGNSLLTGAYISVYGLPRSG
ncbi:MAG TPA: hypothetical protein VLH12_08780 [Usitatibacter sp.]|nr:hypothetical protein [Usitatibacter sp.]